jgi:hypothetical protein
MPKYRALVPVLLAFDVRYPMGATATEKTAIAKKIITNNLGEVGDEAEATSLSVHLDKADYDTNAALYPSDHDWCDTMAYLAPTDEEEDDPIALVAQFLADELEQRENGGDDEYVRRAREAVEKFEAIRALLRKVAE